MKKIKVLILVGVVSLFVLLFSTNVNLAKSETNLDTVYYSVEGNATKIDSANQFKGEKINTQTKFFSDLKNVEYYVVQGEYDTEKKAYNYDYTIFKPDEVKDSISIVASPYSYNDEKNQVLIKVGTTSDTSVLDNAESGMESSTSTSDLMIREEETNN